METKSFFKTEKDRLLWIRLNAERIQYCQKMINKIDEPLGVIGNPDSYMQISLNQLIYDETCRDKPRFSFEELVLSHEELFKLDQKRNSEVLNDLFRKNHPVNFDDCSDDDSNDFNPGM